jgi:hypothetical protein
VAKLLWEELIDAMGSEWARARMNELQEVDRRWESEYADQRPRPASRSSELNATGRKQDLPRDLDIARTRLLSGVAAELAILRDDVRARANRSFYLLMIYAALGGAAVLTAAGLAIAGATPAAALSGIGGVLSGGVAAMFWRIYVAETRRADDLIKDLQTIEVARISYLLSFDSPASDRGTFTIEKLTRAPKEDAH